MVLEPMAHPLATLATMYFCEALPRAPGYLGKDEQGRVRPGAEGRLAKTLGELLRPQGTLVPEAMKSRPPFRSTRPMLNLGFDAGRSRT